MKQRLFSFSWLLMIILLPVGASAYDLVVAKDGSGNFTTVQAAINAAPTGRTTPYTIFIKNGTYREKITIPSNKPFIHIIGESVANTLLYYDDPAIILGTQGSASFTVNATDFMAADITFQNRYGDGSQAVAVLVNNDRAVFLNCRFLGNQDTVYLKGAGTPRCYFRNCYIDGNIDFIFGSAVAYFDSCVVYAKRLSTSSSSFITAPNTPAGQAYGFIFNNARLPMNTGGTQYFLSRPWPSPSVAGTAQKTVFLNSRLSSHIQPAGWTVWDANTVTANTYYGEYQSRYFNGTLVNTSSRVPWSYQLSALDAGTYTLGNIFGDWDPCAVAASICAAKGTDIAVANFSVTKAATTQVSWNISWPLAGIQYDLYRSSDNSSYSVINTQVAATDTAINFSYSEAVPPAGQTYYYYLRASVAGLASHITDTFSVTSAATISVTGSLGTFLQGLGTPSAVQTFTVSGINLSSNISLTPPAGYQISSNNGSTWSASPIELTQVSGTVSNTVVSVRLNAGSAGTYNGNITLTSAGASTVNVPVSGTVQSTPLNPAVVLQQWPLTANNNDDAGVRSPGVVSSVPQFSRLFLSNGTTVTAVPAYSVLHGQAYGPSSGGDGVWTSVGGNLSRTVYQQFTVTGTAGYQLRIDSLVLSSSFYNTSSNTKLGIVYSLSGFTTDSSNVTGGFGPTGTALAGTANGAYTTPVLLTNETAGTNATYRFALNGANGVTVSSGQTLTIRLYNSCSSSSAGRYGKLKNVIVKGSACNPPAISSQPQASQTVCEGGIVTPLSVVAGGSGLIYTWFSNTVNSYTGGTQIANQTASSYTPPATTAGQQFYYCVITGACGSITSAIAEVNVSSNFTVTASAGANGSISPSGATQFSCAGTGNQTYTITPNSGYLIEDVLVDGVSQGPVSSFTFNNISSNRTIAASFALEACTSNNFSGTGNWTNGANWSCGAPPAAGDNVTILSGANVTLNTDFNVAGSFTLQPGATMTVSPDRTFSVSGSAAFNGQPVTFKSDAGGYGSLGQVTGSLTGATNVTVERFIPNAGFRSWRLLSVPTSGSQTIKAAWQEGNTPLANNVPGYGTLITGGGNNTGASQAIGFDFSGPNTSMLFWNNTAWGNLSGTLGALSARQAYFLFVRGDRSKGVTGLVTDAGSTTLRSNGTIYTGTQVIPATNSYSLIPNLYPSAINFTGLIRSGVANNYTIWDAKTQAGNQLGRYVTFSGTNGWEPNIGTQSYPANVPNTTIESGQAFFVSGGAGATITLQETAKTSGSANGNLGLRPVKRQQLRATLSDAQGELDGTVAVFDAAFSNAVDGDDAQKMGNPGANLAIELNSRILSVEGRQPAADKDAVQFRTWNLNTGTYTLKLDAGNIAEAGVEAILEDSYTKTSTPVQLNGSTEVSFSVDASSASKAANRFRLVFRKGISGVEGTPAISIAPNPVTGGMANLKFSQQPEGRYTVRVMSLNGQVLLNRVVVHPGGSSNQQLNLGSRFASGNYRLEVISPAKVRTLQNLLIKN